MPASVLAGTGAAMLAVSGNDGSASLRSPNNENNRATDIYSPVRHAHALPVFF
jgi:hypothetical protein